MNFVMKVRDKLQTILSKEVNSVYERHIRRRLINNDFTLLCSNCIGGIIYHRLGLQFHSPTVNLWMHQRDFLKLATNPDLVYGELHFIHSEYDYPVAELNGITIYFNHSSSEEEARRDWERRAKRINPNNIFLIMYDREDITEEDIRSFGRIPCRGCLVLSSKAYPDIPYVKTMKPSKRQFGQQFIDRDWLGFRTFEKHFDYVAWLNQQ